MNRMEREWLTVLKMLRLACTGRCGDRPRQDGLCGDCLELMEYARQRLARCPFQEGKTVCSLCPVHCYQAAMRGRIRDVMRYAGPRMIFRHPILAAWHMLDQRRKRPFRADSVRSLEKARHNPEAAARRRPRFLFIRGIKPQP